MTQIFDSNPGMVLDLFQHIPEEEKYRHPIGYISYIGFYTTNVDMEGGARLLSEAEEYFKKDRELSPVLKKRIEGELTLIRAYIDFNDVTLMHEKLKKAHELLDGHSYIANKDKIITFGFRTSCILLSDTESCWTVERLEELYPYRENWQRLRRRL